MERFQIPINKQDSKSYSSSRSTERSFWNWYLPQEIFCHGNNVNENEVGWKSHLGKGVFKQ